MAIPPPRPGAAALVTGASSGIGAELARLLAARGHDLVLVARRRERLDELAGRLRAAHGHRVEVLGCDVADGEARDRFLGELDALGLDVDVLVCSAGFGMGGPFVEHDADRVVQMIRTNVEATMLLTRALLAPMVARRSGAILLVSSFAGNQPMPNFGAYAATKAAVTSFAEALSGELRAGGITVTALAPGGVRTEFSSVAGMLGQERQTPGWLLMDVDECAAAALDGLERGKRVVMPRRSVRAFAWFGAHAPRAVWLPLCRFMLRAPRTR